MKTALQKKFAEFEFPYGKILPQQNIIEEYDMTWVIPTYDNDNDIDRCIRMLDSKQKNTYVYVLGEAIVGIPRTEWLESEVANMLSATTEQKIDAFVKVMGWEDSK